MLFKCMKGFRQLIQYITCSGICLIASILLSGLDIINFILLEISILAVLFYTFDRIEQVLLDYFYRKGNNEQSIILSLSSGFVRMFLAIILFLIFVKIDRSQLLTTTCIVLFYYMFSTISSVIQIIKKEGKYKS